MEKQEYYKNEMIKRYRYIHEYAEYIFSLYMTEGLSENTKNYKELSKRISTLEEYGAIDIRLIDPYSLFMLETLLFEDKPLEETQGYIFFESLRANSSNKVKSKKGIELKDEFNKEFPSIKLYFDTLEVLSRIYENIARQSDDFSNKESKLKIIDEYMRIAKYSNDEYTWSGGYSLSDMDKLFNPVNFRYYNGGKDLSPSRFGYDVGVRSNQLIETSKELSFSEEDKKKLYLKYHEELPYDLKILCSSNGVTEVDRPQLTKPCNKDFVLKAKEIFSINEKNDLTFLTLCPYCLYIVGVESRLLPKTIKDEVSSRDEKDPLVLKEAHLRSELAAVHRLRLR